ncbi:MAG: MFS transporter, partial [Pseudomonadota bacterium]
ARFWVGTLFFVPAALAIAAWVAGAPTLWLTISVVLGLLVFGGLFALNSALHSYLILAFTSSDRVTLDVGFYYMANAAGRLLGTVLSGLTYQTGGLPACLGAAALMIALSWLSIGNLAKSDTLTVPAR